MCDRLAMEFEDGWVVNLGFGIPALCSNCDFGEKTIILHSENGIVGMGPLAREGEEDIHLVNAGGQFVTLRNGAAVVDHSDSFAIIRGGYIDVAVMGAYEVASNGDFANWTRVGERAGRIGGAMDLAVGAQRIFIAMEHTTKRGQPRLVKHCTLPVTAIGVVKLVVTNLGLFELTPAGFLLKEIAPGYTFEEVQAVTEAELSVADDLTLFKPFG